MKKTIISAFILLIALSVFSQTHTVNGTIPGLVNQKVYLLKLMGEKRMVVDTTHSDHLGSFTIEITDQKPGMFALVIGQEQAVELIYNYENIRFTTTGLSNADGIQIIESVENLIYYDYMNLKGLNLYKMDLLSDLIQQYPTNDEFYIIAVSKFFELQDETNNRIDQLIENNEGTIAAKFITTDRPVIFDPRLPIEQQNDYIRNHYFDNVNFNDTILISSTILTSKAVGYLSLFQEEAASQEDLEKYMLSALDTVLLRASDNQKVYEFLTDFFISGFESIGFEKGLTHIAENSSLDNFCENTERKAKLENKMELIMKFAIGKTAPDFTTSDINGNNITLSKIDAEKTVLIFWASWCPHCDNVMPIINEYANENPGINVIAISVDDSEKDLKNRIDELGYNWTFIGELQGWEGPIINEYGIAATPTVIVLDKDKKIVAKPLSKTDIIDALK